MWYQVLELQTQPSKADDTWHLCEKKLHPRMATDCVVECVASCACGLQCVCSASWVCLVVSCLVRVVSCLVLSCRVLCVAYRCPASRTLPLPACHGASSTRPKLAGPLAKARNQDAWQRKLRRAATQRPQKERPQRFNRQRTAPENAPPCQRTTRPCQRTPNL